jgi:hypothetical protein
MPAAMITGGADVAIAEYLQQTPGHLKELGLEYALTTDADFSRDLGGHAADVLDRSLVSSPAVVLVARGSGFAIYKRR